MPVGVVGINLLSFFRLTKDVIIKSKARVIYVATDQNPYTDLLESHLKEQGV